MSYLIAKKKLLFVSKAINISYNKLMRSNLNIIIWNSQLMSGKIKTLLNCEGVWWLFMTCGYLLWSMWKQISGLLFKSKPIEPSIRYYDVRNMDLSYWASLLLLMLARPRDRRNRQWPYVLNVYPREFR